MGRCPQGVLTSEMTTGAPCWQRILDCFGDTGSCFRLDYEADASAVVVGRGRVNTELISSSSSSGVRSDAIGLSPWDVSPVEQVRGGLIIDGAGTISCGLERGGDGVPLALRLNCRDKGRREKE